MKLSLLKYSFLLPMLMMMSCRGHDIDFSMPLHNVWLDDIQMDSGMEDVLKPDSVYVINRTDQLNQLPENIVERVVGKSLDFDRQTLLLVNHLVSSQMVEERFFLSYWPEKGYGELFIDIKENPALPDSLYIQLVMAVSDKFYPRGKVYLKIGNSWIHY